MSAHESITRSCIIAEVVLIDEYTHAYQKINNQNLYGIWVMLMIDECSQMAGETQQTQ